MPKKIVLPVARLSEEEMLWLMTDGAEMLTADAINLQNRIAQRTGVSIRTMVEKGLSVINLRKRLFAIYAGITFNTWVSGAYLARKVDYVS